MITILVNGKPEQIPAPKNLQDFLQAWVGLPEHFAIAVNQQFVAKENYPQQAITAGDAIEILVAMQGG